MSRMKPAGTRSRRASASAVQASAGTALGEAACISGRITRPLTDSHPAPRPARPVVSSMSGTATSSVITGRRFERACFSTRSCARRRSVESLTSPSASRASVAQRTVTPGSGSSEAAPPWRAAAPSSSALSITWNWSAPAPHTGHFTAGFGPFAAYPHAPQTVVVPAPSARMAAAATPSAIARIFSGTRPGMNSAMAPSITLEVTTVCPCSVA